MDKLPDLKSKKEVQEYLRTVSREVGAEITDPKYAQELDSRDQLSGFREKFRVPKIGELLEGSEKADGMKTHLCIVTIYICMHFWGSG